LRQDLLKKIKFQPLVFQSVAIWLIDQSHMSFKRRAKNIKKVLNILFYFFAIYTYVIVTAETLVRVLVGLIKKQKASENIQKYGLIYFAKSHYLVLEQIMSAIDPTDRVEVSSRTFKEILKWERGTSKVYIDDFINLRTITKTQLRWMQFILTHRASTVNFFNEFSGFKIVLFQRLILKLFLSVRFEILTNSFYSRYNYINRIFLGNDSCYRSFWLIENLTNNGVSCTIQHGIPENLIQYYSISNFFMAWDSISLDKIIKNDHVNYSICGYPKQKQIVKKYQERNSILIILTRINDSNEFLKLKKISDILKSKNFTFYIKFHPLESAQYKKEFKKENIYSDDINTDISNHILYVIDTTVGIDLAYNGIDFLPLTFDCTRTFNSYFNAIHIDNFIQEIEKKSFLVTDSFNSSRFKLKSDGDSFRFDVFKQAGIL
jgi:hypothetical protein